MHRQFSTSLPILLLEKQLACLTHFFFLLSLLFLIQSSGNELQLVVAALLLQTRLCVRARADIAFLSLGSWDESVLSSQRFANEFDGLVCLHV